MSEKREMPMSKKIGQKMQERNSWSHEVSWSCCATKPKGHDKVENNCSRRVFFEWTTAEFTGTWRSLGMTAPQNSAAVTDVTFHSTHRKGYQSKLLFFHSKGGRCSFWGLLYCDDRRSPWWASRDGLQHDHIRSDTVMIRMNFNSYASLVIFFIISVFFCFVFEHWTLYNIRVLAVFDFITVRKLAI